VIKAGKSTSLYLFGAIFFHTIFSLPCRNIVTYHAEDGSGVGSAIIAGACGVSLGLPMRPLTPFFIAMTKSRKDKGLYLNV
jgi:hypothetical protein